MFTGIIVAVGTITSAQPLSAGVRVRVASGSLMLDDVGIGDSIAVSGVCLTVVACGPDDFEADVSKETLECTAGFPVGGRVNLEKALRLSDRLGGHLVSGHVDGVGKVVRFESVGDNRLLVLAAPAELGRYIARKGSIAVNGVSLTVNTVTTAEFSVNLIPHTLKVTTLCDLRAGDAVNLEVDLLARYLERLASVQA